MYILIIIQIYCYKQRQQTLEGFEWKCSGCRSLKDRGAQDTIVWTKLGQTPAEC